MKNFKKIGIMGGTFNPIHYGHLVLAEQARTSLNLECIYFVPSGKPPHKDNEVILNKSFRHQMVKLAIKDNPNFDIFDYELRQSGKTYTIDTIRACKKNIQENAEIYFITGADQLMQIETWQEHESLFKEIIFVGASRPGYDEEKLFVKIDYLKNKYNASIIHVEVPALAISSTDIRNRIREGKSIKYLLPENVEKFILTNELYL